MRKHIYLVVLSLSLIIASVIGIGASGASSSRPKTIKIAAIIDLSGTLGARGVAAVAGINVAVKQINDSGGVTVGGQKYDLTLVKEDTAGDPSTAAAETTRETDSGVKFIFGGLGDELVPMADVVAHAKAILFTQTTTAESLYTAHKKDFAGLFQTTLGNSQLFAGYAKMLDLIPGVKRVAFLFENFAGITGPFIDEVGADAKSAGQQVVATQLWDPSATDFTSVLTTIAASHPDLLFFGFDPVAAVTIVREAVQLKVAKVLMGTPVAPSVAIRQAIGSPIPVPLISAFPGRQVQYPVNHTVAAFDAAFKKIEGYSVDSLASSSDSVDYYDFVFMLRLAMEKAESVTNIPAIEKALTQVTYSGVLGSSIKFSSATHTPIYDMDACITQHAKVKCLSVTP